jgi:hypothetical protein
VPDKHDPLTGKFTTAVDPTDGQAGSTPFLASALQEAEKVMEETQELIAPTPLSPVINTATGTITERGNNGRFLPGSKPLPTAILASKKAAKHRAVLLASVTAEDVQEVTLALIQKAKSGHLPAIVEFFNRTVGKPLEADVLERLSLLEATVRAAANGQEAGAGEQTTGTGVEALPSGEGQVAANGETRA